MRKRETEGDADLLRLLAQRLAENGPEAARLREAIGQTVGHESSDGHRLKTT